MRSGVLLPRRHYRVDKNYSQPIKYLQPMTTAIVRTATVTLSPSLKLRSGPGVDFAQIGSLMHGTQVEVLNRSGIWAQVRVLGWAFVEVFDGPGTSTKRLATGWQQREIAGWCSGHFLSVPSAPDPDPLPEPDPEPQPPPPSRDISYALGINALQNTPLALEEARRGCKFFLIMDDFGGAANLKRAHPQATVMVRRYFPQNFFLQPDQVVHGLEGAQHGALVYTGFNEADQGGQDGNDLRTRARIDIAVARKIKERNPQAIYAAGTFSVGTPDFTNPDTCRIIREEYAPHYNSGLIALDMHLYSPNPANIDKPAEWQWYERRWEFLFTRCGFDPNVRAIYCGEAGLDQGGTGGFPAHGVTQQYFRDWCRKYIALQSAPLVVNGKSYPSPIIGGAIFQLGGNGDQRWEGYNIASYLPTLREFYGPGPRARASLLEADQFTETGEPDGN